MSREVLDPRAIFCIHSHHRLYQFYSGLSVEIYWSISNDVWVGIASISPRSVSEKGSVVFGDEETIKPIHDKSRRNLIRRMRAALVELRVPGVKQVNRKMNPV